MTHKISAEAAKAFYNGRTFRRTNTEVTTYNDESSLYLHGNRIAWTSNGRQVLNISQRGWDTATTNDRLRALGVSVYHKRGQLYINDEPRNACDTVSMPTRG